MISQRINNRLQAFLIHLACSAFIATLALILVFVIWYPGLLAPATGVTEIFLVVLGVDVCLGPLLTLIVFNPKKKELKRDLFIIFLLQLSALVYGLYSVGIVRPVYVVFEIDRFQLVYANDLSNEKLNEATEEFRSLPLLGPQWVSAKFPEDIDEKNEFLFSVLDGADDLGKTPKYYIPYNESREDIINRLSPLEELKDYNLTNPEEYNDLITRYSSESTNVGFLPLKGYVMDLTVVIDKSSAEMVEMVKLRPWGE
jgi:hypothetical protein